MRVRLGGLNQHIHFNTMIYYMILYDIPVEKYLFHSFLSSHFIQINLSSFWTCHFAGMKIRKGNGTLVDWLSQSSHHRAHHILLNNLNLTTVISQTKVQTILVPFKDYRSVLPQFFLNANIISSIKTLFIQIINVSIQGRFMNIDVWNI